MKNQKSSTDSEPTVAAPPPAPATQAAAGPTRPVSELVKNPAAHAAAARLHKWAQFAHHNDGEISLSQVDYDAAIEAVSKRDPATKKYKPHAPALFSLKK